MNESAANDSVQMVRSLIGQEFKATPSPFGRWLSSKVVDAERGNLALEYVIREEMANPMGYLHGGVIAGIADDIIGTVLIMSGIVKFASLNLYVEYIASARLGDSVLARAKLTNEGKRIISTECVLWDQRGTLLARASSQIIRLG